MTLGETLRDEGINTASNNASDAWRSEVEEALMRTIRRLKEFTSCDIYDELGGELPDGADPRALGGVLLRYRHAGLIQPTDNFTPHRRASRHASPVRIWRSLI